MFMGGRVDSLKLTVEFLPETRQNTPKKERIIFQFHGFSGVNLLFVSGRVIIGVSARGNKRQLSRLGCQFLAGKKSRQLLKICFSFGTSSSNTQLRLFELKWGLHMFSIYCFGIIHFCPLFFSKHQSRMTLSSQRVFLL